MTGIRPQGKCPECNRPFTWVKGKFFVCEVHQSVTPKLFIIDFYYKGQRIRRGTTLEGKTLRTFADAHALLTKAKGEIAAHKFDPTKWSSKERLEFLFETLIEKWYQDKVLLLEKGRRAYSYVPKLKGYIKNYYLPFFAGRDVREILPMHIKEWHRQLPDRSAKTVKNLSDALSSFFKVLFEDRVIEQPLKFPEQETLPEHEPEILSPEEQLLILQYIPEEHKPIFTYLFFQGCRPSEARALQWKDIDGDTVTYRRTWSANRLHEHTKTKNVRVNLLFPETLQALPNRRFGNEFVFTHGKAVKRPYGFSMLNSIYRKTIEKVNARHGLSLTAELYEHTKHSFGTQLANKGVDMTLLKDWFGHTTLKTTEKYAKLNVVNRMRHVMSAINGQPAKGGSQ